MLISELKFLLFSLVAPKRELGKVELLGFISAMSVCKAPASLVQTGHVSRIVSKFHYMAAYFSGKTCELLHGFPPELGETPDRAMRREAKRTLAPGSIGGLSSLGLALRDAARRSRFEGSKGDFLNFVRCLWQVFMDVGKKLASAQF